MIYIELILLSIVVVFVVDVSGVVDDVKGRLSKWLNVKVTSLKPFDCSMCMVWWSCLMHATIYGQLSLRTLVAVSMLALLSIRIGDLIRLVPDIIGKIIDQLYKIMKL